MVGSWRLCNTLRSTVGPGDVTRRLTSLHLSRSDRRLSAAACRLARVLGETIMGAVVTLGRVAQGDRVTPALRG